MLYPLRHLLSVTCLAVLAMQAGAAQAATGQMAAGKYTALRPGLWEVRTSTQLENMPYELPPVPYTTTQCMTQAQLDNQQNLSAVSGAQGKCDIHDANVTATRTSWTMTCMQNGMQVDAKGAISPISREAYTGKVHFVMQGKSTPKMNGVVNVQGLWKGECVAGQQPSGQMQPSFREPVYTPN